MTITLCDSHKFDIAILDTRDPPLETHKRNEIYHYIRMTCGPETTFVDMIMRQFYKIDEPSPAWPPATPCISFVNFALNSL